VDGLQRADCGVLALHLLTDPQPNPPSHRRHRHHRHHQQGVPARQHDAWDLGFTTTDDFGNADICYEETLNQVQAALTFAPGAPRELPIVTGFLAKGKFTRAVTTLGRGGSDLSATVLGAALHLKEVQVRVVLGGDEGLLRAVEGC